MDLSAIKAALPVHPTAQIAHYTRIVNLPHFTPENGKGWSSAWATPVQFLNDRMELTLGLQVLRSVAGSGVRGPRRTVQHAIDQLHDSSGGIETDAFQMSFSGDPDELGQWRGYAANGMGCSVITEVDAVRSAADLSGWVIYDAKKQQTFARRVIASLRDEPNFDVIARTLVAAASFMKHDGFRPEQEYRVIIFPDIHQVEFRASGDRLVPFVDFLRGKKSLPIKRILIGPGWQLSQLDSAALMRNHVVQGIHRLLTVRGLFDVSIESSRIPYDPQ